MIFSKLEVALYLAGTLILGWILYPSEYTRGLMLRQEGDRSEAIAFFESYLERNPYHKGATLALAEAYEAAGRPEEAIAPMNSFYEHRRGDAESGAALMGLLNRTGLDERADEFRWRLVADLRAKRIVPRRQLETILFQTYQEAAARQDDPSAKRALLELASLDEDDADSRDQLLRLMLARGELEAALALLRENLKRDPRDEHVRRLIVRVYRLRREDASALAELDAGLKFAPETVGYLADRAAIRTEHSEWEKAAADYASLKKIEPAEIAWRRELGAALLKLGRVDEGAAELEAVLERRPRERDRWWDLIYAYADNERHAKAAGKLEAYLRQFPEDRKASDMLVYEYRLSGRVEKAIAALEQRVRTVPGDQKSRRSLVSFLRDEERFADCVEHYQILLSQSPKDRSLRPSFAYVQQQLGDTRAAAASFESQIALFPDDKVAMDKLVSLLEKLGERDKAIRILQRHFQTGAAAGAAAGVRP
ncbi:MAG: hypothetical protein CO113_11675 [Elusimicrobia bacterium CG_4_9_14_3_um_filter_62_55]|nr:MAG: hypothetical protein COR54_00445 [Elusimicrobia bacterium CG22_combo_CG10-13_8_21_14_all_63_91]PJA15790.1 MAG: hypothetical protein COX66_09185 [Elusimicrobia bacterium CG_4_10_14_0_2_um_filter_63_34]PJB24882.1 MAG: hypothetical protein CO113_11675 [Elusimicrobia bacterium CG_4_9_14_3_um_filter_62_55]